MVDLRDRKFWATAPGTDARAAEMRCAEQLGIECFELKQIEAFCLTQPKEQKPDGKTK